MSFPPGTEMFHFPGFALFPYEFRKQYLLLNWKSQPVVLRPRIVSSSSKVGCPIRKSTDQRVLAPPRSLSQRATSFIASHRQGIRRMPLFT
jgi:hypothetical protein